MSTHSANARVRKIKVLSFRAPLSVNTMPAGQLYHVFFGLKYVAMALPTVPPATHHHIPMCLPGDPPDNSYLHPLDPMFNVRMVGSDDFTNAWWTDITRRWLLQFQYNSDDAADAASTAGTTSADRNTRETSASTDGDAPTSFHLAGIKLCSKTQAKTEAKLQTQRVIKFRPKAKAKQKALPGNQLRGLPGPTRSHRKTWELLSEDLEMNLQAGESPHGVIGTGTTSNHTQLVRPAWV